MQLKLSIEQSYKHIGLLLCWIAIGTYLRLANLELKPPWSDEWATLVFSLGNSFRSIPLNEVISLDKLLSPLYVDFSKTSSDTIANLLTESTHPPLFFTLNHWWLQLTGVDDSLVSLWWARCFSVLWGIVAIPAMFVLGYSLFRSVISAHLSSLLMAVSPFGVYLAQEARHYTLTILFAIASLSCLVIVIKNLVINNSKKPSYRLILFWIVVNVLGVATHYFFSLTLVAEVIVLIAYWWQDGRCWFNFFWRRVYLAIIGTAIGCLPWLFLWRSIPDNQLTSWVYQDSAWYEFYQPIGRILLWWIVKIMLLPIEGIPESIAIAFGAILLIALIWLLPSFLTAYKQLKLQPETKLNTTISERFLLAAIALILLVTYTTGADLTLASRFQFFYFPGYLLFIAGIISYCWQRQPKVILIIILLGVCGSLSINHNLAFQKVERADLVVPVMVEAYQEIPVVIAIQHNTHGQTGEIMSLGWQFERLIKRQKINWKPRFILANTGTKNSLQSALNSQLKSFQLWLINFSPTPNLTDTPCIPDEKYQKRATGYKYGLYNCIL